MLKEENIKYETYYKLLLSTGMRRGEACGLRWSDVDWADHSIHIQRNVIKISGEDIIVKEPKTVSSDRYVYFSVEMDALWDCLDGLFLGQGSYTVIIKGYMKMKKELREACKPMLDIFDEVHNGTPNIRFNLES